MSKLKYLVSIMACGWIFVPALAADQKDMETPVSQDQKRDAMFRFHQAMRMWSAGGLGGLLFYHRVDGPLSKEIERQNFHPTEGDALPTTWHWRCLRCRSGTDCDATILVRFSDEDRPSLRRYRIFKTPANFWGLHSETRLEQSAALAAEFKSCRSEMTVLFPKQKF